MKKEQKRIVKTVDKDGNELELAVRRPTADENSKATIHQNKAFREAVDAGALTKPKANQIMRRDNIWGDEQEQQLQELDKEIYALELKLKGGGIRKSTAKDISLRLRQLRADKRDLIAERNSLDAATAESQGLNARFNYLVSCCTVYNTNGENHKAGDRFFESYEDYLNRANEQAAYDVAMEFGNLWYGLDSNYELNLPENKFLIEHGFADEDGRLIDKEGNYVTVDGKHIDKDGYYLNEDGERCDIFGNLLDENGEPIIEFKPFLDDDEEEESQEEVSEKEEETAESK